jgi:hypothetical protein
MPKISKKYFLIGKESLKSQFLILKKVQKKLFADSIIPVSQIVSVP